MSLYLQTSAFQHGDYGFFIVTVVGNVRVFSVINLPTVWLARNEGMDPYRNPYTTPDNTIVSMFFSIS